MGTCRMEDRNLRRTSEHIWNAWMDLNYALADLNEQAGDDAIRFELKTSVEKLRVLAERVDLLSAGAPPE